MDNKNEIPTEIILGYNSECPLCGKQSFGKTKELSKRAHEAHVDNDCKVVKIIRRLREVYPDAEITMAEELKFLGYDISAFTNGHKFYA